MFNSINNPFNRNQKIESSTSSDSNSHHQREQKKEEKKRLIDEEEQDEVRLGGMPILTEDEILSMVRNYINKMKDENSTNEKAIKKLDKYLEKFDVKKFMKKNPNMTSPDFYMVMFNEVGSFVN